MHRTGLRLFFYEVANCFGLASKGDLEAARAEHMKQLNALRPACDHYRDTYAESRGSRPLDCARSYPNAGLWK